MNHTIVVVGKPLNGKSMSLKYLDNFSDAVYLNSDMKPLNFKDKFEVSEFITNPHDIIDYINECNDHGVDTIVLDTLSHLMRTFRTIHIDEAVDTRDAWGEYSKFYNKVMFRLKSRPNGTNIILCHVNDVVNKVEDTIDSRMCIQGNSGAFPESDFTNIVEAVSLPIDRTLYKMENDYFKITEEEDFLGVKYAFVTKRFKKHPSTKARSSDDMWSNGELYIDNNIQYVIDRVKKYYD